MADDMDDPDFFPMMMEQALDLIEEKGPVSANLAPFIKDLATLCKVQLPAASTMDSSRRQSLAASVSGNSQPSMVASSAPGGSNNNTSLSNIPGMINTVSEGGASTATTSIAPSPSAGAGAGAAASSSSPDGSSPTTVGEDGKQVIPMRACVVCGQVRAGEQRKSGFKCYMHIGVPSSATFVSRVEELDFLDVKKFAMEKTPLGKGSFGRVHRATHIASGQKFAVKILDRDQLERMKMLQKIESEIHILKMLSHPNIVKIYAVAESHEEDEAKLHIMMEYLEGGQLCDIDENGRVVEPMPLLRMKKYLLGVLVGLQYMNDKGFVHRDIKPENILIDRKKDCAKLSDFGVSSDLSGEASSNAMHVVEGSPAFMPPELFESSDRSLGLDALTMGKAHDIWSTGITAFAMAFGFLPFFGKSRFELTDQVLNKPLPFPKDADPVTVDMIRSMLQRDILRRATIPELLQHPFFRGSVRIVKGIPVESYPLKIKMRQFPEGVPPTAKIELVQRDDRQPAAAAAGVVVSEDEDEDCTVFLPPGVAMGIGGGGQQHLPGSGGGNGEGGEEEADANDAPPPGSPLAQWTKAQAALGQFVNEAAMEGKPLELVVGSTYSVTLFKAEQ